eukprot:1139547-Pelagomonas_calceolata.AAC.3
MLWELAVVAASAGTANTRYNSRNAVAGSAVAPMAGASSPGVPPIMSVLGYEQKGGLQDNQKKLGTGLTVLFFKLPKLHRSAAGGCKERQHGRPKKVAVSRAEHTAATHTTAPLNSHIRALNPQKALGAAHCWGSSKRDATQWWAVAKKGKRNDGAVAKKEAGMGGVCMEAEA